MMNELNRISEVTRRNVFDELRLTRVSWAGRLSETDFLSRIFDLKQLPSNDYRVHGLDGDILIHRQRFTDWPDDWVYDDVRLNLLRGPDDVFLQFLCEMIHPVVRPDRAEVASLQGICNRHLALDGFEIVARTVISGQPIFSGRPLFQTAHAATLAGHRIAHALASDQIAAQITRMETSIDTDPALAIGSAKEFVESICKGILMEAGASLSGSETLPQLVKSVRRVLDLEAAGASNETIKRTVSALAGLTQGIAELRGQLGSGHGHHPATERPSPAVARLAVGAAVTLGVFLFDHYRNRTAKAAA